jgi:hypothetical protein
LLATWLETADNKSNGFCLLGKVTMVEEGEADDDADTEPELAILWL